MSDLVNELTVYRLLGEDMTVWAKLIDRNHVAITIQDEHDEVVFEEDGAIYAWESFVNIAKQVLAVDKRIQEELEALNDN